MYEAIVAGSLTYGSMTGQLNGLQNIPPPPTQPLLWDVVANEVIHSVSDCLFSYLYATLADYNYIRKSLDTLQSSNKSRLLEKYKDPKLMEQSV